MKEETEEEFVNRWSADMMSATGQFYQWICEHKSDLAVQAFVEHAIMQIHLIGELVTNPERDGGLTATYQSLTLEWPVIHHADINLWPERAEMDEFYRNQTGKRLGRSSTTKARMKTPRVCVADTIHRVILDGAWGKVAFPDTLLDEIDKLPPFSKANAREYLALGCKILAQKYGKEWADHFIQQPTDQTRGPDHLLRAKDIVNWATNEGKEASYSYREKCVKKEILEGLKALAET